MSQFNPKFSSLQSLSFEKLAKFLRDDLPPLIVHPVYIHAESQLFSGHGKICIDGKKIAFEVTLDGKKSFQLVRGAKSREHFWKIGGIIENQIPFWTLGLPHSQTTYRGRLEFQGSKFRIDRIHHIPDGIDLHDLPAAIRDTAELHERGDVDGDSVTAVLTNFKILACNEASTSVHHNPFGGRNSRTELDTVRGRFGKFDFALIQRNADCEIHMRRRKRYKASSRETNRAFRALLNAIAFAHGQNAWPQYFRLLDGAVTVEEWTCAANDLPRSIFTPVTEQICFSGNGLQTLLEKAAECFNSGEKFSETLKDILFRTRESGNSSLSGSVATLRLCSLFEGIVNLCHKHFISDEECTSEGAFETEKQSLESFIMNRLKEDIPLESRSALKRLLGGLTSMQFYRPKDKFNRLVQHFSLPLGEMNTMLKSWVNQRNSLAHGGSPHGDQFEGLYDASRIAGGIYVLAMKAMGFTGSACISALHEDEISLS